MSIRINPKASWQILLIFLVIFSGLIMVTSTPARAAGVVGNGQPASCTEAAFNTALTAGGTVTFNCGSPVTITLTTEKAISINTTIDGANAGNGAITLKGSGNHRLFSIAYQKSLSLANLIVRDATFTSSSDEGGSVVQGAWQANLTVANCQFINNRFTNSVSAANDFDKGGTIVTRGGVLVVDGSLFNGNYADNSGGAAIHGIGSNMTIRTTTFSNNHSSGNGNGGAVYNDNVQGNNGFVLIQDSVFDSNTAYAEGGAMRSNLYNGGQSLTVERTRFTNNTVHVAANGYGGMGGAIRIGDGTFTFNSVLFSGNTSESQGGAIWTGETVQLTIQNSAMVNNQAWQVNSNMGFGGGIAVNGNVGSNVNIINTTISDNQTGFNGGGLALNTSGAVNITNSTITNNYAWWQGGGIANATSNVTLRNTIIANNTANNGGNTWNIYHNCNPASGKYTNGGYNLQYSALNSAGSEGCFANTYTNTNPNLGTLGDHGGNTQTRLPQSGSPAINAIPAASCASATDQRGITRPIATNCDIGAVEVAPPPTLSNSFSAPSFLSGWIITLTYTLTNPSAAVLTQGGFTNNLPAGLTVAPTPNVINNCGAGSISATAGSSTVTVSGLGFSANKVCTISLNLTGTIVGNYANTPGALSAFETGAGPAANTASVRIDFPATYYVSQIPANNTFQMGAVKPGNTKTVPLYIQNLGSPGYNLLITGTQLTGANASSFSIANSGSLPATITGGNSFTLQINCAPSAVGPVTATLTLTTNNKGVANTQISHILACAGGYAVKVSQDNGGADTLSYILANQAVNPGDAVVFDLPQGVSSVSFTKATTLNVKPGVIIDAGCTNGPAITIDGSGAGGNGLVLGGNNFINGVIIQHFPQKQILVAGNGGNQIRCTRAISTKS